jgi:hypothetical protein
MVAAGITWEYNRLGKPKSLPWKLSTRKNPGLSFPNPETKKT